MKLELVKDEGLSTTQQLVKLIVSTTVGFGASKLAEKAFMKIVEHRREIAAVIQS